MKPILEVRGISKKYKIGTTESYLSLRDNLVGNVKKMFSFAGGPFKKPSTDSEFWALKDVSFDVMPGESVGIIGRNGAGKSTLLKILSKITPPTEGHITARGRVASLLEVGTGFHPELTGRENIYLNGSILGLRKWEIDRKFDEIVEFSGVERFLDTTLKHYSSGMQLRLAFSVAAHLEPEILVIDEVLAVGDAEFQKKCLGKMDEVSKSGRTVLFVSHQMGAVQNLCSKGIVLTQGRLELNANISSSVGYYLRKKREDSISLIQKQRKGSGSLRFINFEISQNYTNEITIQFTYNSSLCSGSLKFYVNIVDAFGSSIIFLDSSTISDFPYTVSIGLHSVCISLTNHFMLQQGSYSVNAAIVLNDEWVDHIEDIAILEYDAVDFFYNGRSPYHKSLIIPKQTWKNID